MENPTNTNEQKVSNTSKRKFSLLTLVLIICVIELTFGAIQNINKTISFRAKIKSLEAKRNEEVSKNKRLKSEIENFNSDMILESIARNNLKMAGEDEVLIIINNPNEKDTKDNQDDKTLKNAKNRP